MSAFGHAGFGSRNRQNQLRAQGQVEPYGNQVRSLVQGGQAAGGQNAGGFSAYSPQQGKASATSQQNQYSGMVDGVQYYNQQGTGAARGPEEDHYDANGRLMRLGSQQFGNFGFAGSKSLDWENKDALVAARNEAYDAYMKMYDPGTWTQSEIALKAMDRYGSRDWSQDVLHQRLAGDVTGQIRSYKDDAARYSNQTTLGQMTKDAAASRAAPQSQPPSTAAAGSQQVARAVNTAPVGPPPARRDNETAAESSARFNAEAAYARQQDSLRQQAEQSAREQAFAPRMNVDLPQNQPGYNPYPNGVTLADYWGPNAMQAQYWHSNYHADGTPRIIGWGGGGINQPLQPIYATARPTAPAAPGTARSISEPSQGTAYNPMQAAAPAAAPPEFRGAWAQRFADRDKFLHSDTNTLATPDWATPEGIEKAKTRHRDHVPEQLAAAEQAFKERGIPFDRAAMEAEYQKHALILDERAQNWNAESNASRLARWRNYEQGLAAVPLDQRPKYDTAKNMIGPDGRPIMEYFGDERQRAPAGVSQKDWDWYLDIFDKQAADAPALAPQYSHPQMAEEAGWWQNSRYGFQDPWLNAALGRQTGIRALQGSDREKAYTIAANYDPVTMNSMRPDSVDKYWQDGRDVRPESNPWVGADLDTYLAQRPAKNTWGSSVFYTPPPHPTLSPFR